MRTDPALLVASPGGHAEELFALAPGWLPTDVPRVWLTARTPHTVALLAGEDVEWVPAVGARQGFRALGSVPLAARTLRRVRPRVVISTGAALSVPYLLAARAYRVPVHYVESATRFMAPSLTGRMVSLLPGVRLHHQSLRRPGHRWARTTSVFDGFAPQVVPGRPVRRVVVSVGTERFPLTRALQALAGALPTDADVLWQTGYTPTADLPGRQSAWVQGRELEQAVRSADVVVTHAGVGSVLSALRCGQHPLVFARRSALGEHVDDHQVELARDLQARGLVTECLPGAKDLPVLLQRCASMRTVRTVSGPPPHDLGL